MKTLMIVMTTVFLAGPAQAASLFCLKSEGGLTKVFNVEFATQGVTGKLEINGAEENVSKEFTGELNEGASNPQTHVYQLKNVAGGDGLLTVKKHIVKFPKPTCPRCAFLPETTFAVVVQEAGQSHSFPSCTGDLF